MRMASNQMCIVLNGIQCKKIISCVGLNKQMLGIVNNSSLVGNI